MTTLTALSGPLPKLGVVLAAACAALALVAAAPRLRAAATLGALVLAPALLLADIWHSPQLGVLHRHPLLVAAGGAVLLLLVAAGAVALSPRPGVFAVAAVAALPFRIPISVEGTSANLLLPLYVVVFAGAVMSFARLRHAGASSRLLLAPRGNPVEWLLGAWIVLYAVQAIPSPDFPKALQQTVFFYVPFALLFSLLRRISWSRELVRRCLITTVALAALFSLVGFVEFATKSLLLNPKLVAANEVHTYFTVNSVFFDPDIFGRYLGLAMIALAGVLLHARESRRQVAALTGLTVLWACLVLTLSRSSLGALLLGLAILAALRWRPRATLALSGAVVALGVAAILLAPRVFGLNQGLNGASSGRAGLVSGGISLFAERPLAGWGSASFVAEYRAHHPGTPSPLAASHTIAVTIAAEQGVVGLLAYAALIIGTVLVLARGARGDPVRSTLIAAFLALIFHTMLYADFLEDPVTWALLALGVSLAAWPAATPEERPLAARGGARV